MNHVSEPSTSAQSGADIVFFDDFIFWVATLWASDNIGIQIVWYLLDARFNLTLQINVKFVNKLLFFHSYFYQYFAGDLRL